MRGQLQGYRAILKKHTNSDITCWTFFIFRIHAFISSMQPVGYVCLASCVWAGGLRSFYPPVLDCFRVLDRPYTSILATNTCQTPSAATFEVWGLDIKTENTRKQYT
jgi:hypothetical protein